VQKFRDRATTASGEPRAPVDLRSLKTLWFNTAASIPHGEEDLRQSAPIKHVGVNTVIVTFATLRPNLIAGKAKPPGTGLTRLGAGRFSSAVILAAWAIE